MGIDGVSPEKKGIQVMGVKVGGWSNNLFVYPFPLLMKSIRIDPV